MFEANEKRHTGVVTPHPELRQAVNKTWGTVWDSFEKLHQEGNLKKRKVDNNNLDLSNRNCYSK